MYRIDILLKQKQRLFHTRDLAILWGTDNTNTLYTTIKRYVQNGVLVAVHKGLYATIPIADIDPYTLGVSALHTYAYVSCETVLSRAGIIFQADNAITLVSSISRRFTLGDYNYIVRKMHNRLLYCDVGIERKNGILTAGLPRAVCDMLYFNPTAHFDNPKAINWPEVQTIQKEVGFL